MAYFVAFGLHRPLMGEGSEWYLGILSEQQPYRAHYFYRYLSWVIHLPALAVLKLQVFFPPPL